MTTTAFDDQYLAAPELELVREHMSREAILRRNVAALEVALRQQTELKEKAEAELAKLREQKPVAWRHENGNIFLPWQKDLIVTGAVFSPLFAAPVPAPHPGATHCDDCGLTWLDDGLNPLWCPYCKESVPAPAVPAVVFVAHNKTSSILFAARKDAEQYVAGFGPAAGVLVTECAVIGSQSSTQAPAVPKEWREVMTELAADLQAACDAEHPHRDQYPSVMRKYNNDMEIVEKARALLQSAEVTDAAADRMLENENG